MKRTIVLIIFAVLFLGVTGTLYAENIYTKDGQTIKAKIAEKTEDTIWYEVVSADVPDIIEVIGIEIAKVEKVLNDDGTVSVYSPTYTAPVTKK